MNALGAAILLAGIAAFVHSCVVGMPYRVATKPVADAWMLMALTLIFTASLVLA